MGKYILAIDQGTTGTTAIVFDDHGRPVCRGYQEFPQYYPRPGWVEHDPGEIWQSTMDAIRGALYGPVSARRLPLLVSLIKGKLLYYGIGTLANRRVLL